jgi:hypothetical protein
VSPSGLIEVLAKIYVKRGVDQALARQIQPSLNPPSTTLIWIKIEWSRETTGKSGII